MKMTERRENQDGMMKRENETEVGRKSWRRRRKKYIKTPEPR